ncbi:BTB/POZ domain-containing protein At5g66560-like [Camellia sinensis]|uniref:BTB/POZ domain-containing protein At5g66560-like n=1 Tax=Camellia sinensis TaxID=4442 RepID=UPI001035DF34|nr:BTB/POZ domain-containing protein At5g66560-like [Camellia sinensis]
MASKGQAWFCTTGLPSDVVVEVENMAFHLHKFPLMSKSNKLHELITEQETNPTRLQKRQDGDEREIEEEEEEEEEDIYCHISLPEFPGGSEAFETAAKFCYGVKIGLSSSNVAPLRCAGEVLEMTEEYSEDNLISKTERFLSQSVFKSIKDSIKTLKSCEKLMPMAETLGIVQRCIDSIAARAFSTDPSLFGWPVNENPAGNGGRKTTGRATGADSWFDELAHLGLILFKRLIFAMKARDLSPDIIENCLICYAKRYIPGILRSKRKPSSSSIPSENEQRELLETIIENLPVEKSSRSSTTTRFLFGLLRTANILKASDACRVALERKIGSQLEQATLDDLLIPSYSYLNETLYDVHCVERILGYFLDGSEERFAARIEGEEEYSGVRMADLMSVGKLIDGYLGEIASDANLKPEEFYQLAVALPQHARIFDDGLYRAVDVYLKSHPWLTEDDREKICGVMDCQKLTLEACTHAAQNERLPLRAVVQVLFFEQLQLRQAIAGNLVATDAASVDLPRQSNVQQEEEEQVGDEGSNAAATIAAPQAEDSTTTAVWRAAVRENQVLKLDMDSMRSRVHELERECSSMKKAIDKLGPPAGWKRSLTKKFGCKFHTQVCDSHERTVVEPRQGRNQ